jgi:hypothetical protein
VPSALVSDLLDGHVQLDLECLDRIYLNAYIPNLQCGGQVLNFITKHLRQPIASPAVLAKIGEQFRAAVCSFCDTRQIPVLHFKSKDRQIEIVKPYFDEAQQPGVVAVGVAQEFQSVFTAYKRAHKGGGPPYFAFEKADRRVTAYYFYILDAEFGPAFIKLCSYFPYPGKVWVNGHEWAKRQAAKAGLCFTELANGFSSCENPRRLQSICDRLGPNQVLMFFEHWMKVIPTPLGRKDRLAGYFWELSMRQVEVSRTLVFDAPRHARAFFEAVVQDNLDIGRPDEVKLIFARQIRSTTKGEFASKVVTRGTDVTINAFYKHSRIKEYLKEGRALRIETVVNSPTDLGVQRRLTNLAELVTKAKAANRRMLDVQRAGQGCAIETALFERISQPSLEEGQRTGALRFGEPRTMALAGALCVSLNTVVGFTNRSLRAQVSQLLGAPYSSAQMTYDLRRLRLKGLVERVPGSHRYKITGAGLASLSSTPSATTGFSDLSSSPTGRPRRPSYDKLSGSSSMPSTTMPPAHTSRLPKTCLNFRDCANKGALAAAGRLLLDELGGAFCSPPRPDVVPDAIETVPQWAVCEQGLDRPEELGCVDVVGGEASPEARLLHTLSVVVLVPEQRQHDHRLGEVEALRRRVVATVGDHEVDDWQYLRLGDLLGSPHVAGEFVFVVSWSLADDEAMRRLRQHFHESSHEIDVRRPERAERQIEQTAMAFPDRFGNLEVGFGGADRRVDALPGSGQRPAVDVVDDLRIDVEVEMARLVYELEVRQGRCARRDDPVVEAFPNGSVNPVVLCPEGCPL